MAVRCAFSTWTRQLWLKEAGLIQNQLDTLEMEVFHRAKTWNDLKSSWNKIDSEIEVLNETELCKKSSLEPQSEATKERHERLREIGKTAANVYAKDWSSLTASWGKIDNEIKVLNGVQLSKEDAFEHQPEVIKEMRERLMRIGGVAADVYWGNVEK